MENYITLEELKAKEEALIAEYNRNMEKGYKGFADYSIKKLEAVRYVMELIEKKNR